MGQPVTLNRPPCGDIKKKELLVKPEPFPALVVKRKLHIKHLKKSRGTTPA